MIESRSGKTREREPSIVYKTEGATEHDANVLYMDLAQEVARGGGVWRWSRGRVFTFYWRKDTRTMMVRIGKRASARRNGYKHVPVVELLAKRLSERRTCRLRGCGAMFARNGKQAYCSPAHASTARSRRQRGVKRSARLNAVVATVDAVQQDGQRRLRAEQRRRQRVRKARREAEEARVNALTGWRQ